MAMVQLMRNNFLIFTAVCILFLNIGMMILKKYCKAIPDQLLPIIALISSVTATMIWYNVGTTHASLWFYLEEGITNGLASVGLHQLIKQLKRYFSVKKYLKYPELDRRKRDRRVS